MSLIETFVSLFRTRGKQRQNLTEISQLPFVESEVAAEQTEAPQVNRVLPFNPALNQKYGYNRQGNQRPRPPVPLPPFLGSAPQPQGTKAAPQGLPVNYDPYRTSPLWDDSANSQLPDMSSYRQNQEAATFDGQSESVAAWAMLQHMRAAAKETNE
jgi:hypothetical protein